MTIAEQSAELLAKFKSSLPKKPRHETTAVDLEREECAKLAEHMGDPEIAEAIRQRSFGL